MFFSIVLTLIIFSSIGLVVMIAYRGWELKTGKVSLSKIGSNVFPLSEFLCFVVSCEKEHMPRVLKGLFSHGKRGAAHVSRLSMRNPLADKVTNIIEAIQGKAFIAKRESTSLFLKTIIAHKEKIRNGKRGNMQEYKNMPE